jgi:hypothetical protein
MELFGSGGGCWCSRLPSSPPVQASRQWSQRSCRGWLRSYVAAGVAAGGGVAAPGMASSSPTISQPLARTEPGLAACNSRMVSPVLRETLVHESPGWTT